MKMQRERQFTIMGADLHNGSFEAAATGFWASVPASIPAGWVETRVNMYTTVTRFVQAGSTAEAVNNTGELVQAGHQYTVSADLGGQTNTTATVRVYATQNANGTGTKILLAQVSRPGNTADGYNLSPVSTTGSATDPSLAGYYVQITIGGPYVDHYIAGYYDNIVVTSVSAVGSVCGDAGHPYPIGDLTLDCYVNGQDLEMFAGQWLALDCAAPEWCEGADLDHAVNNVNLQDLAVLAANWMNCTNPSPPCCCNP